MAFIPLSPRFMIEPVMFLVMLVYIMCVINSFAITQADVWYAESGGNETLVRYCLYNKTEEICSNLIENSTTSYSLYNTWMTLENGLVGIVVNLLCGYLLDRFPRTLFLHSSTFSLIFIMAVQLFNSLVLSMPIWTYFITTIIAYLGGSFGVFMSSSFAYVADVSDKKSRTTRIVIADSMIQLGAMFAVLIAGELMAHSTWYSSPLAGLCIVVFAEVYLILVIRNPPRRQRKIKKTLKENVIGLLDVYTEESPYKSRIYVLSAAYLFHFTAFISFAGFLNMYLLGPPFNWATDQIGIVNTASSVGNFVLVLSVPLWRKFGVSETLIGIVACGMCAAGYGVMAIARSFTLILISGLLKSGSGVAIALYRSRLSKLVKPTQYGQLFSILNSLECVANLISSVGMIQVYQHTRHWFNGFAFTLLVVMEIAALFLTGVDGVLAKRQEETDETVLVGREEEAESFDEDSETDDRIIN